MELIAKELYHGGFGTLHVGESTEGKDISEEMKQQMLADHPEVFEQVSGKAAVKSIENAQTPEDSLVIETGEAKIAKSTRKK